MKARSLIIFVVVFLEFAAVAGLYFWFEHKINSVKKELVLSTNLDKFSNIVNEINHIKAKQRTVNDKYQLAKTVEKLRSEKSKVLFSLTSITPAKIWFSQLKISDDQVGIFGNGLTNDDISLFLNALEQNSLFQRVKLDYATRIRSKSKETIYQFAISGQLNNLLVKEDL